MSHAGGALLVETARRSGLANRLSVGLGPWRLPLAVHDPGTVVLDLAAAHGGDGAGDVAVVRAQPSVEAVVATGDLWAPYRLVDASGLSVGAVTEYLKDLQAAGRPATTQRSYGMALLRWFRFLWAIDVGWDQTTRVEARDFCRWLALTTKQEPQGSSDLSVRKGHGAANTVTGKPRPGTHYAPATAAHSETVLRSFYDFHRDAGSGPMVNSFPLSRRRRAGRAHAHHNPMEPYRNERAGLYRPQVAQRVPRRIPDEMFDKVFAQLGSHRDRALVAFWVPTGARASELLGACTGDADAGQQLIKVVRKGSRAVQPLRSRGPRWHRRAAQPGADDRPVRCPRQEDSG